VADAGTPVIVGVGYGQRIIHSFDGTGWTLQQRNPNAGVDEDLLWSVAYGGGHFVAGGGSSVGFTMVSTDGVTWAQGGAARAYVGGIAWTGSCFIAVGGNGLRVRSTDLGATWTNDQGFQTFGYFAAAAGNGIAVGVGYDQGVAVITTTTDGTVWTERRHSGASLYTVAYGNGMFVAAGDTALSTSHDGITWTDTTLGSGQANVNFVNGEFLISHLATGLYRSPDGVTWSVATPSAHMVGGYINGTYVSPTWPLSVSTSTNLVTWTSVFAPMGSGITQMVVGRH
jgi:hypothetical protein